MLLKGKKTSTLPVNFTRKRIQTDFVLLANGVEIGARETKLPGIYEKLIEEDRTRTAEILK